MEIGMSKTLPYRLSKRVAKDGECLVWTGAVSGNNYGHIYYGRNASGKHEWWYTHRVAYILHHGPIPDGLDVCHTCDNTRCVNPDHLFLGTAKDNVADAIRKGRYTPWARLKKLTANDVREIRKSAKSVRELAQIHDVSIPMVYSILRRRVWKAVV